MPTLPKPLNPRDFVIRDPFGRTMRFYTVSGRYYRRDESVLPMATGDPDTREVSKVTYAINLLDFVESEGLALGLYVERCQCGEQLVVTRHCPVCDRGE